MNAWLYRPDIGVDVVVSSPDTIAQLIEEELVVGDIVQLARLHGGPGVIVETTIPGDSQPAGVRISDARWPAGCTVVAVIRAGQTLPAAAETLLATGWSV
jgi:Trk K+ transport system NAD-binding subunit